MASQLPISRLVNVDMDFFGSGVVGAPAATGTPVTPTLVPATPLTPPSITGVPQASTPLVVVGATFAGDQPITVSRTIFSVNKNTNVKTLVAGPGAAAAVTYTPIAGDVGLNAFSVTDTPTNDAGTGTSATSATSAVCIAAAVVLARFKSRTVGGSAVGATTI